MLSCVGFFVFVLCCVESRGSVTLLLLWLLLLLFPLLTGWGGCTKLEREAVVLCLLSCAVLCVRYAVLCCITCLCCSYRCCRRCGQVRGFQIPLLRSEISFYIQFDSGGIANFITWGETRGSIPLCLLFVLDSLLYLILP